MEVCAAKAIGADAGAAWRAVGFRPLAGLVNGEERRVFEVDIGVRGISVERRRHDFVVQGQGGFQKPGRARAGFEVADVALGRPQADAAAWRAVEHGCQALDFDYVADAGAGAVGLDECRCGRV